MFYEAYIGLSAFFAQGGDVLYLIALTTFLMWTLIFERVWYFRSEHRRMIHAVTDQWESRPERRSWSAHVIREALISQARERIDGSYPIILTCVRAVPALGASRNGDRDDRRVRTPWRPKVATPGPWRLAYPRPPSPRCAA